ncbi:Cytochrome c oxidase subunit 2 (fragment) [Candidatus Competibacter denitrificans Run_A_D11]|jgi:cytochrome c oxidase subunit 2|uniref:Cytochrome c oxidase subunit 2 n=1 Tax=Candidatus Competibacter denitrificans Run_A_D11 TaxID=1400863 RepID=W6M1G5_9GAMM
MAITRFTKWGATGLAAAPFLMWGAGARAELGLNMPQGVTAVSREVYDLHMLIFWICVVIAIGVFGVMFWSIFHHRKSRGAVPAQFHESTLVEIVWTVVPMLILIGMAVPATKTLVKMYDSREAELTIKVTGYQWRWQYDYLDQNVGFLSVLSTPTAQIRNTAPKGEHYLLEVDNPMVVPVGKKVRILTTAADVIHSWWVPELGWKKDAIPGFINESWTLIEKPGIYRGQCAELCGKDHGYMPIVVKAVPEAEFKEWLAQMQAKNKPNPKTANDDNSTVKIAGGQTL